MSTTFPLFKPFLAHRSVWIFLPLCLLCLACGTKKEHTAMVQQNQLPDWASDAIWYQIFPERFRNGDTSNDPTLADQQGAWPHDASEPWQIHSWTSDWYALADYEKANGHDLGHNIQRRRYGGDIQGILDALPYLEELGVNALYLNPVFTAPSSHKYDGAHYHHVDPTLGPDPVGDRALMANENPVDPATWKWTSADLLLLELVEQVHARGMHLILDGVFNHLGMTSFAFRDVQQKGRSSEFADWFTVKAWPDSATGKELDYEGWFGVRELPELREDAEGLVPPVRDYIFAATERWLKPEVDGVLREGIDGWRLDVAFCISHPFWKKWRAHVRSLNPQAYLVAEVIEPLPELLPYLEGDEFDAMMNYNFAFAVAEFLYDRSKTPSPTSFDQRMQEMIKAFGEPGLSVMQNLLDSHDSARLASQVKNGGGPAFRDWGTYFGWSQSGNPDFDTSAPGRIDTAVIKMALLLQMTCPGAPMVYYGDEAGMWGANDPDCRKPMVWPDYSYEDETLLPDGTPRPKACPVRYNAELRKWYEKLIHIRNMEIALRRGHYHALIMDDDTGLYAFERYMGDEWVVVVMNPANRLAQTELRPGAEGEWYNAIKGGRMKSAVDGSLRLELGAYEAAVLVRIEKR